MTDARVAALQDQATAADRDAAAFLAGLAERGTATGAPVVPMRRFAFHDRLIDRLRVGIGDAVRSRQSPTCDHLESFNFTRAQVLHWLASRPGRLRCAACLNDAMSRERGRERCNLCSRRDDLGLRCGAFKLPPSAIFERGDAPPAVLAGLILHWTLCAECLASGCTAS